MTTPALHQSQLHVVEELLELFGIDTATDQQSVPADEQQQETVMAISRSAVTGWVSSKAFQLCAWIQGREVLMLVDSGSTTSFINKSFAEGMAGIQPLLKAHKVRVADGGELICSASVPNCTWCSQGHQFSTDLKVLDLGVYDVILGMDWLEEHSPMTVDWRAKLIAIPSPSGVINLRGHDNSSSTCVVINALQLQSLCSKGAITHMALIHEIAPEGDTSSLPPACIHQVLDEFDDVFKEPVGLPPRCECDHRIPLIPGAQPFSIRAYRHKPDHKDEIERQVAELLRTCVIQRSNSPFSSPAILVKKDGTWRLCIDNRQLNAITCVSKYPVPVIEELLDELHGATWFSKLDLRAGYHQIRLAEGEEFKTAFQTHSGHYEFRVVSFGLTGGPPTFLGAMNTTVHPLLRVCVLVFFDDILVFSKTLKDNARDLRRVLALLRRDQWKAKFSKCAFGQQKLSYLGHVISEQGVATEPTKIRAVAQWTAPTSVKEVRSFLGMAGYYRRFVKNFGIIARPLFNLLKKGVPFVWTSATETAFQVLKQQLVEAPILALPDFSKTFIVETDASDKGIGAVLQQGGHPIAYMSKALSPRYQGLSTYEKEYLAVIVAVDQWRPYLQHDEFIISTDQRRLVHLNKQRLATPWQQKAFTKLLGLRFSIRYKKGSDNTAADALSRAKTTEILHSVSSCQPAWLEDVINNYNSNPQAQRLLEQLAIREDPKGRFTLKQGLLRFRDRIWLGGSTEMQQRIISAFHDNGGALRFSGDLPPHQKTVCLAKDESAYLAICALLSSVSTGQT